MINFMNDALMKFRSCFSREAAFKWFVAIVVGIMARGDHLGVTSAVRDLHLACSAYIPMLNFFR
jgi:hypothetical protein